MSRKMGGPLYGIGGVTLLTVLLVLVLTMFSVLAFSSSQADYRLSQKNAQVVSGYYAGEVKAMDLMKQAQEIWPDGTARPAAAVFSERLQTEFEVFVDLYQDGVLFFADIVLDNALVLHISLYLRPGADGARWEVRQWQVLPPDQDLGDIFFLNLL